MIAGRCWTRVLLSILWLPLGTAHAEEVPVALDETGDRQASLCVDTDGATAFEHCLARRRDCIIRQRYSDRDLSS